MKKWTMIEKLRSRTATEQGVSEQLPYPLWVGPVAVTWTEENEYGTDEITVRAIFGGGILVTRDWSPFWGYSAEGIEDRVLLRPRRPELWEPLENDKEEEEEKEEKK